MAEAVTDFLFLDFKVSADGDCSLEIRRWLLLGRKAMTKLDSVLKKQRYHVADKGPYNQIYGLSSSHVQMQELGNKRALKNRRFWTVVLENTTESPLENNEIKLINL